MKNPKLKVRNHDRVYTIKFYENHKRKFKSLGTKDKMEAVVLFTRYTGFPVPAAHKAKQTLEPALSTLYGDAVNKFILRK